MITWIGILGFVAGLVVLGVVRAALRPQRSSIRQMLDDSQPCATRSRQ